MRGHFGHNYGQGPHGPVGHHGHHRQFGPPHHDKQRFWARDHCPPSWQLGAGDCSFGPGFGPGPFDHHVPEPPCGGNDHNSRGRQHREDWERPCVRPPSPERRHEPAHGHFDRHDHRTRGPSPGRPAGDEELRCCGRRDRSREHGHGRPCHGPGSPDCRRRQGSPHFGPPGPFGQGHFGPPGPFRQGHFGPPGPFESGHGHIDHRDHCRRRGPSPRRRVGDEGPQCCGRQDRNRERRPRRPCHGPGSPDRRRRHASPHFGPPGHYRPLGPFEPDHGPQFPFGPSRPRGSPRPYDRPYNCRRCCADNRAQNSEDESGNETERRGRKNRRNCYNDKADNRDTVLLQRIVVEKAPRCYSV